MTTAAYRRVRDHLREHGRRLAGGQIVAPCELCRVETYADRL